MDAIALLAEPGLRPFLSAVVLVVLFLGLELALTAMGVDARLGGAEAGAGPGADATADLADLGGPDLAAADLTAPDPSAPDIDAPAAAAPAAGVLAVLGLRDLPLTGWLAFLAAFFAATGLALQAAAQALTGAFLPGVLAGLVALPAALTLTGRLARGLARLLPRHTSSAISERSYGRRRGVVTVGTARAGQPAQVRFTDGHGNLHYLMAEPFDPADTIPEGAEVLILRLRDASLRIVRLD